MFSLLRNGPNGGCCDVECCRQGLWHERHNADASLPDLDQPLRLHAVAGAPELAAGAYLAVDHPFFTLGHQQTQPMARSRPRRAERPPFIIEGIPQFVETCCGEYFFVPSMAQRVIGMGVVDPT